MDINPHIGVSADDFISENMGLVVDCYKRQYSNIKRREPHIDRDDAFQAGRMGLFHAYKRYDGSGKISTYAVACISGYMLRLINSINTGCKYSVGTKETFVKIHKRGLADEDPEVIASTLDMPKQRVLRALSYGSQKSVLSLDVEQNDERGFALLSLTYDMDTEESMILSAFLDTLNEKEQKITNYLRAGYSGAEVAQFLGCTRASVSQNFLKVLAKAKNFGYNNEVENLKKAT